MNNVKPSPGKFTTITFILFSFLFTSSTNAQKKPNILFIMGDDIGWMQPSCYHRGLMVGETPNIDRIASEGAIMMCYYAEQSCTSGRNAFITGMHPLRTGMIPPQLPGSPLSATRNAMPYKFLLDQGYNTGDLVKIIWVITRMHFLQPMAFRNLGLPLSSGCHARSEFPRHQ
jgi:arylsulfatase